jgi:2-polyprenyl-3-methyl-5-hydroxy-6-metoxy-1,4-benzoquinol methylase
LTGIDLGSEYVEFGKKEYGLNLYSIELKDLKGKFDLIIMSHVFEHIINLNLFCI